MTSGPPKNPERAAMTAALAAALREARLEAGLTVQQLVARMGCSERNIQCIEAGSAGVGLHFAWRVADALRIPLADIIERAEEIRGLARRWKRGAA